jgi:hypothetical protein
VHIDEYAPVTARGEIEVAASPELIWDLLTRMDHWADWNPDVKTASQPAIEEGAIFWWKSGPATLTSTLGQVDRPRKLGWTGTSMGIKAMHVWRLESDGQETLARIEESWSGTLPRLLPSLMRRSLQKTLNSWLHHLKIEAEAQADTRAA